GARSTTTARPPAARTGRPADRPPGRPPASPCPPRERPNEETDPMPTRPAPLPDEWSEPMNALVDAVRDAATTDLPVAERVARQDLVPQATTGYKAPRQRAHRLGRGDPRARHPRGHHRVGPRRAPDRRAQRERGGQARVEERAHV